MTYQPILDLIWQQQDLRNRMEVWKRYKRGSHNKSLSARPLEEWGRWQLRVGMDPESGMGVNRTGIYTDFT